MSQWTNDNKLGFDFETAGTLAEYALQPWRYAQGKFWATSLAYLKPNTTAIYGGIDPTREMMECMLQRAIDESLTLVGWNVMFDIQVLLAYGLGDLVAQCKFLDGMLLWKHATVTPEYGLDRAHKRHYGLKGLVTELWPGHSGYEEGVDFQSTEPEMVAKRWRYNIRDTIFTLRGAAHWWNELSRNQQRCALIEAQSLPIVAEANFRGIPVDTIYTHDLSQMLETTAQENMDKLAEHGVTPAVLRSPTQLSKLLFTEWELPVVKRNKSASGLPGSISTDKEALHELQFFDERAKWIKGYRDAVGNNTKFAIAPATSVAYNEDGCTHPQAFVFSTYSGRLTYASKQGKNKDERPVGFALHQEKRGKEYRDILIPPPGYDLVEFDAAGQEFRWMAIASGDPTMLDLCQIGQDAHTYMGAQIAKIDYFELLVLVAGEDAAAKMKRQFGKIGNLSCQYRTSGARLCSVARVDYDLPMDLSFANHIVDTYRQTYLYVPVYWATQITGVKSCGYAETFAGRRVRVSGDWSNRQHRWALESTAINYRIQGTGADQKYLALAVLRPYCHQHGIRFAWDLHDGLYFFVPKDVTNQVVPQMKLALDTLPYKQAWGFNPPIPLPFDVKVGPSWGSLRKWEPKEQGT